MASSLFAKRTFQSNVSGDAEEKKNDVGIIAMQDVSNAVNPTSSGSAITNGAVTPQESEISADDDNNNAETMSIISDAAIVMSDGGDPLTNGNGDVADGPTDAAAAGMSPENEGDARTKWSAVLSTPSSSPLYTPSSDPHSLKTNLHGLGLKHSVDRAKVLSRTGKGCAALLFDLASLHDDLVKDLAKLCPSGLESAAGGTPMESFARDVNSCIASFIDQTKDLGGCIRNDIAKPYQESSGNLAEEAGRQYTQYTTSRVKCFQARKDALKLRKKYLDSIKDVDNTIGSLRKARASKVRKRKATDSSNEGSKSDGAEGDEYTDDASSTPTSWEEELRSFGEGRSLSRQCEAVIRASEDVKSAQTNYSLGVAAENAAVDDAQDAERMALDSVQGLEEERIVFLIGLLDRLLQDSKESLESMSLDLGSLEPLDLTESKELPPSSTHSMAATSTAPSSLFMSPRRRAQSDDGPAINETRMLNLPDNIAEIRDNMKSLIGRQLGRLKALKAVSLFNEGLASAFEAFASSLKSLLEGNPSTAKLGKNEGASVLGAWNALIGSLEAYAKCAEGVCRQIKMANNDLMIRLVSAERSSRAFQETEEFRWKSLCDAARVEAKAKAKHRQLVAELEKAQARVNSNDGEAGGSVPSEDGASSEGGDNSASVSPQKPSLLEAQSKKMDRHMNKAMGRMFAILPGGGEDVMNKMLTAQQRNAIATRQLDEAKSKEEKGTESFEVARSVKQQAVASYETEAEATEFKFRNDDRHEWNMLQKSLIGSVDAIVSFRDGYLKGVLESIDAIQDRKAAALDDVTRWTEFTEKRVRDQLARSVDDTKEDEEEQPSSPETGFSLRVQLAESSDTAEVLVRRFLDEGDALDDVEDDGGEENGDEPTKDAVDGYVGEPSTSIEPLPEVPADTLIEKMDSIFSKKLKNVTIDEYYNVGWSDSIEPLYKPWLERKGSFDVTVGDWQHASEEDGFENVWSGEKFQQKRVVQFKFKRTTHLYIGPPVAGVTQTQYLNKDGNDRCIVMMTVEMDGIPYSDSFAVEVRWAARRWKESDIAIDAGVFVRITKSNMFASKIKSGTLKETSPIHLDLFDVIKSAIVSSEEGVEGIKDLDIEPEEDITSVPTEANKPPRTATNELLSQVESILRSSVATFLSFPQSQKLLLVFAVFYLFTKILFSKDDSRSESIDDLALKVDNLTKEVKEMKDLLESLLRLSEQSVLQREELMKSTQL